MENKPKWMQYCLVFACIVIAGLADNWSDDPANHPKHVCTDTTHAFCDGECECDGHECPTE